MRLPLAPSTDPAMNTRRESVFGILAMQGPEAAAMTRISNEVAREHDWDDSSLLVENLTAAFARRCDRLMADLQHGMAAPGLFTPVWMATVYAAGVRNELWTAWWSHMRFKGGMAALREGS